MAYILALILVMALHFLQWSIKAFAVPVLFVMGLWYIYYGNNPLVGAVLLVGGIITYAIIRMAEGKVLPYGYYPRPGGGEEEAAGDGRGEA